MESDPVAMGFVRNFGSSGNITGVFFDLRN